MISRKQRHLRAFTTVAACLALSACGIDGLLVQELTRNDHQLMPPPAQVTVTGRVPSLPGATIALFAAAGPVSQSSPTAGIDGAFAVSVDGATGFTNTVLDARLGGRQLLGIIPHLPKQASVLDPELKLDTAQLSPGMANVDEVTTTLALLVLAKARAEARTLTSIAHGSMTDTLIALHTKLAAAEVDLTAVLKAVSRIHPRDPAQKSRLFGLFHRFPRWTRFLCWILRSSAQRVSTRTATVRQTLPRPRLTRWSPRRSPRFNSRLATSKIESRSC